MTKVSIILPSGIYFSEDSDYAFIPTEVGVIKVNEKHAPLVTAVVKGTLRVGLNHVERTFEIENGVASINEKTVNIVISNCVENK